MTGAPGSRHAAVLASSRRRPGVAAAVVVAVALLVAVASVGGYLLLRGEDEALTPAATSAGATGTGTGTGASGTPSASATTTPEPDPLDDPSSPESIDQRYGALAESVTTGTRTCRDREPREGQRERIVCRTGFGVLELVTHRRTAGLVERRDAAVTYAPGGILDVGPGGTTMAFAPSEKGAAAYLYWDDEADRRSATYTAERGKGVVRLAQAYDATGPARPFPTGPSSPDLVRFAARWVGRDACLRTETVNQDALEESYCDVPGPVEVFIGRFRTTEALEAYRGVVVASAIADDRDVREWTPRGAGEPAGALYEYTTDSGTVARYWDDASCACFAEAFLDDGSYQRLARWWED